MTALFKKGLSVVRHGKKIFLGRQFWTWIPQINRISQAKKGETGISVRMSSTEALICLENVYGVLVCVRHS